MNDAAELARLAALVVGSWFGVLLLAGAARRPLAGLTLAYCLHQFINFVLAATLPALEGGQTKADPDLLLGFPKAATANFAFCGGLVVGTLMVRRVVAVPHQELNLRQDVGWLFKLGLLATLVLAPLLSQIPSIGTAVQQVSSLMVVAVGLACHLAVAQDRFFRVGALLVVSAVLFPLVSLVQGGFIGFGTNSVIVVLGFFATRYRPRWMVVPILAAVCYVGLSVFITYFKARTDIRNSVWGGEAYAARFKVLQAAAAEFEWFTPDNPIHVSMVNGRMNQSVLVGAAVERLEMGQVEFARGQTMVDALLAMIPRIIWPDKPMKAGGGNLVSDFTGITFAEGTSVGVGPVLEFYLNFSQQGLVLGALFFGFCVGQCDARAGAALSQGDGWRCARWFMLGLPMILPLASLAEVVMSCGSAVVVVVVIEQGVFRTPWYRRQMRLQARFVKPLAAPLTP